MAVRDVSGATIKRAGLGQVLPHEHVLIDYGQMNGTSRDVSTQEEQTWGAMLARLRNSGVAAIVDCTPPGYGRDLALLSRLAAASSVRIIASTGSFCEQWSPLPDDVRRADTDELAERFMAELQPEAGPPAGVIKVASSHDSITPQEQKVMRAAARAHQTCGAPIVAHTTEGLALEQLDLFEGEGIPLDAVLISHVCAGSEPVEYAVEIARRGAYVGFDRVGHDSHTDQHWADLVCDMADQGLADRVVLSHDSVQRFDGPAEIAGHTFCDPLHLNRVLLPLLADRGVGTDAVELMTRDNPARWLTGEDTTR